MKCTAIPTATKSWDEGDELLGKLEETSTGIYEMSHILYGGVFVRETKAPEGFLLDENAYYVEITENGKIYEVGERGRDWFHQHGPDWLPAD